MMQGNAVRLRLTPRLRSHLMAYAFVAPGLILLIVTVLYPLVDSFSLSFSYWPISEFTRPRQFFGLANYLKILDDAAALNSLLVTAEFAIVSVTTQMVVGLGVGLLLNTPLRARNLLRSLSILPLVMAPLVVGLTWRYMFNAEYGLVNYLVGFVGLQPLAWLASTPWALISIIVADSWRATPFVSLVVLAGLQAIPDELYEASEIDGANVWQLFRHITLPMLRPALLVALVVRTTDAMNMFDKPYIMTQGGPFRTTETLAFYVFEVGFRFYDLTYAAALSWIIFALVLVISLLYVRLLLVRVDL